ncbi:MAG: phage shock protein PspA [Thermoleophilia bacterium]|nr:phage shock protein PspA [Thermoleophilia bacterium]
MGLSQRLSMLLKSKANRALDQAEDPRETLDFAYTRQQELLQQVRRGLTDVAASRKRLQLQGEALQQSATRLQEQATQAVAASREDLAREALTRRAALQAQFVDLERQHQSLSTEQTKLEQAAQRLQAKVEAFRVRKETIKATYTAAEAQTRVSEAVSGISEEMGEVGLAMQRAEDRTQQMQARAGALDNLLESGALEDLTQSSDPIQAELDKVSASSGVDDELARIKGELSAGATVPQLDQTTTTTAGQK